MEKTILKSTKVVSKYYDFTNLLSRNKFLNFVIGHRGVGKTWRFKKWCIDDGIKDTNKKFVWIRRYEPETKKAKNSFFRDIQFKYPKIKFTTRGSNDSGEFLADGKVIGYYLTLSQQGKYKSNPFPDVDKIVFDEFIIMKGAIHYIPNEVINFLELVDTIFRDRDNVRGVYCIANNISFNNPYFMYFNIKPFNDEFYTTTKFGSQMIVQNYKNEVYIENKKKTRFGQLINGTAYGEYAIENTTLTQRDEFIAKKTPKAKFQYVIKYKNKFVGFWLDFQEGKMYANYQYDKNSTPYALTREDMTPNTYLIRNMSNFYIKDLVWFFENGLLYYDNEQIQSLCSEIWSYFIR